MKKIATLAALPLLALPLGACGGGSSSTATSPSTTSKSTSSAPCDPALGTYEPPKSVKLSHGLRISGERIASDSTDESMRNFTYTVCGAPTTGDALKKDASAIAKALKSLPKADKIKIVRATNGSAGNDPSGQVRCEDFPAHSFENGDLGA